MRTRSLLSGWLAAVILGALAGPGSAGEADRYRTFDEKTLREAGVGTDGPALVALLRRHILAETDQLRLRQLVAQLGDDVYATREKAAAELRLAGRKAVPFLRPALEDKDPERARRARDCLDAIAGANDLSVLLAAVRMLAVRRPAEAVPVLLSYLPSASEDYLVEGVRAALLEISRGAEQMDPALVGALTDREPARRAAAAMVVSYSAEHRPAVRRLLQDPEAEVRFQAAASLLRAADRSAVPALIALLANGSIRLAWQAEDLLLRLAGDKPPSAALRTGTEGERRQCQEAWMAWWQANRERLDLAGISWEETDRGCKVVSELEGGSQRGGRVFEYGPDDRIRWQIDNVAGVMDFQVLPGGRVLMAEISANRVTERDPTGKILFEHKLNESPMSCRRLPNGNTFIATYTELREVAADGKVVLTLPLRGHRTYCAHKLKNGHFLYLTSTSRIIELDAAGTELRNIPAGDTSNWGSVELLPNGHFLVARCGVHQVVEIDATGKELWQVKVEWPTWASRRANGRILVACAHSGQVIEFDREGKEVWKQKLTGRPCRVRRY